jgi:hypothetical protein
MISTIDYKTKVVPHSRFYTMIQKHTIELNPKYYQNNLENINFNKKSKIGGQSKKIK